MKTYRYTDRYYETVDNQLEILNRLAIVITEDDYKPQFATQFRELFREIRNVEKTGRMYKPSIALTKHLFILMGIEENSKTIYDGLYSKQARV